ncbi:MAG: hypothetical protein ABJA98_12435 [Acidobacteriota bacterium]
MTDPTMDGVAFLETKAADVKTRLNPAAREAHIAGKVGELGTKFEREYGTAAPKDMVTALTEKEGAVFDEAIWGDLEGVRATSEAITAALAADIAKSEELLDAVAEAEVGRDLPLTLTERTSVRLLEETVGRNLRDDLAGAGFGRILVVYRDALARQDRVSLRFLEQQRARGWASVNRDPDELAEQTELEALIKTTRAGRVPENLREAYKKASRIWTMPLDAVHRTLQGRGLKLVRR